MTSTSCQAGAAAEAMGKEGMNSSVDDPSGSSSALADSEEDEARDCVIIGGGIAGLAASADLEESGVDFVLLEAGDRLGGRIFTHKEKSSRHPLELGAQWLHGTIGNPLFDFCLREGIFNTSDEASEDEDIYVGGGESLQAKSPDGTPLDWQHFRRHSKAWQQAIHEAENVLKNKGTTTTTAAAAATSATSFEKAKGVSNSDGGEIEAGVLGDFLVRRVREILSPMSTDEGMLGYLQRLQCSIEGCDSLGNMSFHGYDAYEELGGGNIRVPGGFTRVVDALARKIFPERIRLNAPVSLVRWADGAEVRQKQEKRRDSENRPGDGSSDGSLGANGSFSRANGSSSGVNGFTGANRSCDNDPSGANDFDDANSSAGANDSADVNGSSGANGYFHTKGSDVNGSAGANGYIHTKGSDVNGSINANGYHVNGFVSTKRSAGPNDSNSVGFKGSADASGGFGSNGHVGANGVLSANGSSGERFPCVVEFKHREHSNGAGELVRTRKIRCKRVLVTVGLGVLKDGTALAFAPPLPDSKLDAIRCLGFGTVDKIFVRCTREAGSSSPDNSGSGKEGVEGGPRRGPHPMRIGVMRPLEASRKGRDFINGNPPGNEGTETDSRADDNGRVQKHDQHRDDRAVLQQNWTKDIYLFDSEGAHVCSWLTGSSARVAETLPPSVVTQNIIGLLRSVTGNPSWRTASDGRLETHDVGEESPLVRSTWNSDPLFRGSYSYMAIGSSPADMQEVARPLSVLEFGSSTDRDEGEMGMADSMRGNSAAVGGRRRFRRSPRVMFAGEATHTEFFSTAHGGYETGRRAAREVLESLGRGVSPSVVKASV